MKKISLFLTLALSAFFLSCGKSPLLNHSKANDTDQRTSIAQQTQGTNEECPLSFPKAGLCASLTWTAFPVIKKKQPGSFTLKFWDKLTGTATEGPYKNPAHPVDAVMWMPSMGHGSWQTAITSSEAGVFQVTNVFFIMTGDWEIQVQLYSGSRDDEDKKTIHEQVKIPLNVKN